MAIMAARAAEATRRQAAEAEATKSRRWEADRMTHQ
jgi:hypothetical protein